MEIFNKIKGLFILFFNLKENSNLNFASLMYAGNPALSIADIFKKHNVNISFIFSKI